MLKTGYLSYIKEYPEPEDDKILIIQGRGNDELAPTKKLYTDWHNDKISWSEYREKFIEKMKNPESQKRIAELAKLSKEKDVRLICYEKPENHCHRHIIAELVNEAGGEVPSKGVREKIQVEV